MAPRFPRILRRTVQLASVAAGTSGFWVGGALLSWIWVPWARRRARDERELRGRAQEMVRRCFTGFLDLVRLAGLVHFDPRAHRPAPERLPEGPFVLVASHPTIIDVIAVLSCYEKTCVVAGGEYWRRAGIGQLLRAAGHIDGGDGGIEATARILEEAQARLRDGESVLIFPEGTRSPVDGLHPFRRGAFEIAARAGVPVVPVVIECDPPALKKGVPWYQFPARGVRYTMKQLDPVHVPRGRTNARRAAHDLRTRMESLR